MIRIGHFFTLLVFGMTLIPSEILGELREVVVSHADEKGILQLYRMREDGSGSIQLTFSKHGCSMPSVSPNGKKLAYVEQVDHSLAIRVSGLDGLNIRTLTDGGMNLIPSWFPDSDQLVFMKVNPKPNQDPARNAKIYFINLVTGKTRRLFTDKEQLKYSNAMPVISPKGEQIAFISDRSGEMRVWVSALDGIIPTTNFPSTNTIFTNHPNTKSTCNQLVALWVRNTCKSAHVNHLDTLPMCNPFSIRRPCGYLLLKGSFNLIMKILLWLGWAQYQDLNRWRYEPDTLLVSWFGSIGFYESKSKAEPRSCS